MLLGLSARVLFTYQFWEIFSYSWDQIAYVSLGPICWERDSEDVGEILPGAFAVSSGKPSSGTVKGNHSSTLKQASDYLWVVRVPLKMPAAGNPCYFCLFSTTSSSFWY